MRVEVVLCDRELGEHDLGVPKQHTARLRRLGAAGMAGEEAHTGLALEGCDLLRDGRRGVAELGRGAGEGPGARDLGEHAKAPDVEH
jgi:hypothetical protein